MSYQLTNNGPSILFTSNGLHFSLMKHIIRSIAVTREDVIKINTGDCLSSIYLRYRDITDPATTDIDELISNLNSWIEGYINTPPQ